MSQRVVERPYRVLVTSYVYLDPSVLSLFFRMQASCEVDVLSPRSTLELRTSLWNTWFEAIPDDIDAYIGQLETFVREGKYDWIVLMDDQTLRLVNERITDPVTARALLPLSKLESRMMLGTKSGLSHLCTAYDIATPLYAVYDASLDLAVLGTRIGYPLLLKVDMSGCGKGVFYCADEAMMFSAFGRLSDEERKNLVLQQYIKGDTIAIEAIYRDGRMLAYTYATVRGTTGGEFAISRERAYTECPLAEPLLLMLGAQLGIHGFATITFMHQREEDRHYVVEADLRPQAWFGAGRFAGVDFSVAMLHLLSGENVLQRPTIPERKGPLVMWHFLRDLDYCLYKRDVLRVLKWVFNIEHRWRYVPWSEPRLFVTVCKRLVRPLVLKARELVG